MQRHTFLKLEDLERFFGAKIEVQLCLSGQGEPEVSELECYFNEGKLCEGLSDQLVNEVPIDLNKELARRLFSKKIEKYLLGEE